MVILCMSFFTSCVFLFAPSDPNPNVYRGEHKTLYTAANHSILGMVTSERDEVIVIETDIYGKTLYLVRTSVHMNIKTNVIALCIAQECSDTFVQYYDGKNVICSFSDIQEFNEDIITELFTKDQIMELKELNDWDKETNEAYLTKKILCVSDDDYLLISNLEMKKISLEMFGHDNAYFDFMTQYQNGTIVCYVWSYLYQNEDIVGQESYVLIIPPYSNQSESNYVYAELEDMEKFYEQITDMLKNTYK